MSKPRHADTLELDQDLDFQKRSWTVQRIGWVVMLLFVLAGLTGLFGGGFASSASAGAEGAPLRIEYERFARVHSPASITVRIATPQDSVVRIWADRPWIAAHELQAVTPEPSDARLRGDRVTYEFRIDGGGRDVEILFDVKPRRAGSLVGRFGLENGPALEFRQFVYP